MENKKHALTNNLWANIDTGEVIEAKNISAEQSHPGWRWNCSEGTFIKLGFLHAVWKDEYKLVEKELCDLKKDLKRAKRDLEDARASLDDIHELLDCNRSSCCD